MNGTTTQNDVWGTLGGFVQSLGDIYIKSETLKQSRATAAPVAPATAPANPFPGFWSAYPQSDTKQQYQNATPFSFAAINPFWLLLLGALGLLFVFARK